MVQKRRSVRLDLGDTKRFAMFTGLTIPTGEGLERGADVVEAIGETLDSTTLKILALALKGGGFSWQSLTNPDKKERRRDAQMAWRALIEAAEPATATTTTPVTTPPATTRVPRARPRPAPVPRRTAASRPAAPDPAENSPTLVADVAARLGCSTVTASATIDALFSAISAELETTGTARVHELGTFTTTTRDGAGTRPTSTVSFRAAASFQQKVAEG